VHFEPPRFILNYIPVSKPVVQSIRGGTSFWVTAGNAGVRSSMLTVPVTFPPENVPNGELLSGLPLPDIRRTMGTFYYFGTDLSRYEEGNTEFGGMNEVLADLYADTGDRRWVALSHKFDHRAVLRLGPGYLICPALARIRSLIAEDHARRVGRGTRQGGTPSEIVIVFSR